MCRFSIIVPCYNIENSAKTLFEMLSSQEYDNYEVVLIDDRSKDNSFEVMTRLAAQYSNFHVYRPEKNGGPGLARNLGLQHARGEYIVFCDSDDEFDVGVLPRLEAFLTEHPEADMLVSPHSILKQSQRSFADKYAKYQHGEPVDKQDVVLGNLAPWAKVYKAEIIRTHQVEFPARRTGEDICFVINYLVRCRVVYKYDFSYYGYVVSQGSITHGKEKDAESTFDILQPIYHEHFPALEKRMFAQNHLLTKAKYLTDHGASLKELKTYFEEQNARYPDWIDHVELETQSAYRKQIYKAIYHNRPLLIKMIMFMRRRLY